MRLTRGSQTSNTDDPPLSDFCCAVVVTNVLLLRATWRVVLCDVAMRGRADDRTLLSGKVLV